MSLTRNEKISFDQFTATEFLGYDTYETKSRVSGLFCDGKFLSRLSLEKGQECQILLDMSPFFSETPCQVCDTGFIYGSNLKIEVFLVENIDERFILHSGLALHGGSISVGESVFAAIDTLRRDEVSRHHTASHLLLGALRDELGGNFEIMHFRADSDKIKLDFVSEFSIDQEKRYLLERKVYSEILLNYPVVIFYTTGKKAAELGAVFHNSSPEVRVVRIADISCEVCKGTHCMRTGDIGSFKIIYNSFDPDLKLQKLEAVAGMSAFARIERQLRSHYIDPKGDVI